MSALNTQIPIKLSTEHIIANRISVQAATEISGYDAQYLRRLLRCKKLDGVKVGQVWLIDLASLHYYFSCAMSSDAMRFGPKGAGQPRSKRRPTPQMVNVDEYKRQVYTILDRRIPVSVLVLLIFA